MGITLRNITNDHFIFQSHLWGMKREPIRTPFLAKSQDVEYADSLAIFKLILRFMNDTNLSGVKETVLADYIANKVCVTFCWEYAVVMIVLLPCSDASWMSRCRKTHDFVRAHKNFWHCNMYMHNKLLK